MIKNNKYQILNSDKRFVDFLGIEKHKKNNVVSIELENGMNIKCSNDHIFIVNNSSIPVNELTENISHLSTVSGDSLIKRITKEEGNFELYDIIEANSGYTYITNGIYSHNCSFLGSGGNFIAEEYLKKIEEEDIKTPIRQENDDNEMWIWEDPIVGEDYIVGVDVSSGHGDDYSTINIYKIKEIIEKKVIEKNGKSKKVKIKRNITEQVAEYYAKIKPRELGDIVNHYSIRYNNAYTVIDVMNGYGANTIDRLMELGYDNLHYSEMSIKAKRDRLNGYIKKSTKTLPDGTIREVDLLPGLLIGANRGSILIEMQRAINMDDVIIRSIRLLNELKTFVTVTGNRVADHKRSFHDDAIFSMAMAIYVLNYNMSMFNNNSSKNKKILDAMLDINDKNQQQIKRTPNKNDNTRTPDFRTTKNNPYGSHSWLFKGLK